MSEYFIQEKQLSSITRTIVKDEDGKSLFLLVGRWGTKGDALSLYTMEGELVASIKQTSFVFGSRFELYKDFKQVGVLKKIVNLRPEFYYIHRLHWVAIGDIYNHRYAIYHMKQKIMEMDKATLFSGDYFILNVPNDEDAPLCICIAAILDYWLYNKKKNAQRKLKLTLKSC